MDYFNLQIMSILKLHSEIFHVSPETITEYFYGIICSGLTDKTKLSFSSSNSSFSNCVRKSKLIPPSKLLSNKDLTTQQISTREGLHETSSFISCSFVCESSFAGGTIYITGSSCSLFVSLCTFDHCSSSSEGGAIAVNAIE